MRSQSRASLFKVALFILSDGLLLSVFAQAIIGSSDQYLSYALLLGFSAAGLVCFLTSRGGQPRFSFPALSLLWVIGCIAELTFLSLVHGDERLYAWIFGEAAALFSIWEIWTWITLALLLSAALRGGIPGGRIIVPVAAMFSALAMGFPLIDRASTLSHEPLLDPEGGFWAACPFLLLALRVVLAKPPQDTKPFLSGWRKGELYLVGVIGLAFLTLLGSALVTVVLDPLKVSKSYPYQVPREFVSMLLVSEDPLYFFHHGIDYKRLRDAAQEFLEHGEYRRGGSTITMQLAKTKYLSGEKTALRKLRQLAVSFWLELLYEKEAVLWEYIDTVPYGPDAKGLKAASKRFFALGAQELSLQQSLLLVLSVYNPLEFNPSMPSLPNTIRNRGFVIESRARKNSSRILTQGVVPDFIAK